MPHLHKLKSNSDLLFLCTVTVLIFPIVIFSYPVILRVIFSFPIILFFPGYTLVSALYPRRESMKDMERLLLSFGLSLAIVPIICFILNYTWSVALYPTLISLTLFILAMSIVVWFRRRRLSEKEILTMGLFNVFTKNIRGIKWNYRTALWILLIILSAAISLFPVDISLNAAPIQSVSIFVSLPLFAALFIVWIAVLLFLLFSKKDGSRWEKLALVCIFAWVFRDFWVIITPYGYSHDSLGHLGMVRYLQEAGKMPPGQVSYWGFPGFHLFANSLVQASGLNLFQSAQFIVFYENIIFTALLYQMSSNFLKNSSLASSATMIVLMTVPLVQHFAFIPHTFAAILSLGFIALLTRDEHRVFGTMQDRLLAIILFLASAITVFWYPMFLFFILAGRYLIQLRTKERIIDLPIILFSLIIVISWQLYFAQSFFKLLANYLPSVMNNFLTGSMFSMTLQRTALISGEGAPLWAQVIQYFWIIAIAGLGTIVGFVRLTRIRRLSSLERMEVAGILGAVLFFIIVLVTSREGYYLSNYITLARIFSALLIVRFFLWAGERLKNRLKLNIHPQKIGIALLVIVLFVVSFPSFLVEGKDISGYIVYPEEITAGEFLESKFGDGTGLTIFTNTPETADISLFYLPNAVARNPAPYYLLDDKEALFQKMDSLVQNFKEKRPYRIFVFSEKTALSSKLVFGIEINDPHWQEIKKQLADFVGEENVWSNEYYSIYIHP